jgi:hypothetical protein
VLPFDGVALIALFYLVLPRSGAFSPPGLIRRARDQAGAAMPEVFISYKHGRDSEHVAAVFQLDVVRRAESGALMQPHDLAEAWLVGDVAGVVNLGADGVLLHGEAGGLG